MAAPRLKAAKPIVYTHASVVELNAPRRSATRTNRHTAFELHTFETIARTKDAINPCPPASSRYFDDLQAFRVSSCLKALTSPPSSSRIGCVVDTELFTVSVGFCSHLVPRLVTYVSSYFGHLTKSQGRVPSKPCPPSAVYPLEASDSTFKTNSAA